MKWSSKRHAVSNLKAILYKNVKWPLDEVNESAVALFMVHGSGNHKTTHPWKKECSAVLP